MKKYFTGYCPTLDDEYRIQVTHLDASTLHTKGLVKDSFQCEHSIRAECRFPDCPIYNSAPDALQ